MGLLNHNRLKIHLVGIAGSGMSGLALLLKKSGYEVSGSDLKTSQDSIRLAENGIEIFQGHRPEYVRGKDLVIYSSAIPQNHIERTEAEKLGLICVHRSRILAELASQKKSIAISGMHGKTSTTGMISKILLHSGMDPEVAAGGSFSFLEGNAFWGRGEWFVFEADESDGTLLEYHPSFAVITNLEPEHMNYFRDYKHILEHFRQFVFQVEKTIVVSWDDPGCRDLMSQCSGKEFLTYGFSEGAEIRAYDVQAQSWFSQFKVSLRGKELGEFKLKIPGIHQISNALAAIAIGCLLGLKPEELSVALENFEGAQRRFQVKGQIDGVTFVDDYAHHPTEVKATLQAARLCFKGKILGIFQPHRYSRTLSLKKEFGIAFDALDQALITDIYPSDELPISDVTGQLIYQEILRYGKPKAEYIPNLKELKEYIKGHFKAYEAVLTLGAGNITHLSDEILKELTDDHEGLKKIRGRIIENETMAKHTTFQIGGPADFWAEPEDLEDLIDVQKWAKKKEVPFFVVGNGSNLIVKDGGIRGVVVRLSSPFFKRIRIDNEMMTVGSGINLSDAIQTAAKAGLSGLEELKGIPGTVGGALYSNAGAFGREIGDGVHSVLVLNEEGGLEKRSRDELHFQYRSCGGLKRKIAIEIQFRLTRLDPKEIFKKIDLLETKRNANYPRLPNAGCIFRNPQNHYAGKIIDELGLKDLSFGGARISNQHGNFVVNAEQAKASDVISLIEIIRRTVYEKCKIKLENEIEIVGED